MTPPPPRPTLMMVHAHPDDESSLTGGTLARYAGACRTILVTCTDGRQGDDAAGRKPGDPGHDAHDVAHRRAHELTAAAAVLGVHQVVTLGYPDSGVDGTAAGTVGFSRRPTAPMTHRLVRLIEMYRPTVLVTYPSNGLSGHPDHIRAHELVTAAHRHVVGNALARVAGSARDALSPNLYYIALSRSRLRAAAATARAVSGRQAWSPPETMGIPDAEITTSIDISDYWTRKLNALAAHSSQADAAALLSIFSATDGTIAHVEQYVRAHPSIAASTASPEQHFLGLPSDTPIAPTTP